MNNEALDAAQLESRDKVKTRYKQCISVYNHLTGTIYILSGLHFTLCYCATSHSIPYLTVWTESVRALVVLHQVCNAREAMICVGSVQGPGVLNQNLAEQTEDQGKVDHGHLDQDSGWPHTF